MSKAKGDDREFRFVVEDVANDLRAAEAVMLTSVEALAAEKPHVAAVLRRGVNELTAAISTLDHAVNNARLAGTRLVVPAA